MGRNLKNPLPSDPVAAATEARQRLAAIKAAKHLERAQKAHQRDLALFHDIKNALYKAYKSDPAGAAAMPKGVKPVFVTTARAFDTKGRLVSFGEEPRLEWYLPEDYPACTLRPQTVKLRAERRRAWIERRMELKRKEVAGMNARYIRNALKEELALLKREAMLVL